MSTVALLVLIGFDIAFLINPSICLLPLFSCTSQTTLDSFHYVIPPLVDYTQADAKRLYRYIQIGCAGLALIFSMIFFVFYCCSKPKGQVAPPPPPDPALQKAFQQEKEKNKKLNQTIESQNTTINELQEYKNKLPPINHKQKGTQEEQPNIAGSMAQSTTTNLKEHPPSGSEGFNKKTTEMDKTSDSFEDEMLKPPKDSQLPPWSIAGPTIGPILGAPPPF